MGLEEVVEKTVSLEKKEILDFSRTISTIKNEDKQISLYDFELYFLPYILGETQKTDANTAVYIDNFLKITKSHHIGLSVMDKDEVLYKLPPLITDTDITKLDNLSFGSIVNKVNIYSDSNPGRAIGLLNALSEEVIKNFELNDNSKDYLKELIKIFHSYPDRFTKVMESKGNGIKIEGSKKEELEEDLFDY